MDEKRIKQIFDLLDFDDYMKSQRIRYGKKDLTSYFYSVYTSLSSLSGDFSDNELFDLIQKNRVPTSKELQANVKRIKYNFFKNKADYRYLLLKELIYERILLNLEIDDKYKIYLQNKLLFSNKQNETKKIDKIFEKIKQNKLTKKESDSLNELNEYILVQNLYENFDTVHLAICSTVSSGKSTFVNALLGNDVLPYKNEATTAKITSVFDKDGLNKLYGFCTKGEKIKEICPDVSLEIVNRWNDDTDITHIYLQGDLDNIGNIGKSVAVHDTPGTNNSKTDSHRDITMGFLSSEKLDALIFVANVEQLETTDEKALLTEIYSNVVLRAKVPIIFVLNKVDSVDNEKEDLSEIIKEYKDYLTSIGFISPEVFPVSAKAARLFKKVIKNNGSSLSRKERSEFELCYEEFLEYYDFGMSNETTIDKMNSDSKITIGEKEYCMNKILMALCRTGINIIEKRIENLF